MERTEQVYTPRVLLMQGVDMVAFEAALALTRSNEGLCKDPVACEMLEAHRNATLDDSGKKQFITYVHNTNATAFDSDYERRVLTLFLQHVVEKYASEVLAGVWNVFEKGLLDISQFVDKDNVFDRQKFQAAAARSSSGAYFSKLYTIIRRFVSEDNKVDIIRYNDVRKDQGLKEAVKYVGRNMDLICDTVLFPMSEEDMSQGRRLFLAYLAALTRVREQGERAGGEDLHALAEAEENLIDGLMVAITTLKLIHEQDEIAVHIEFGPRVASQFQGKNLWSDLFNTVVKPRSEEILDLVQSGQRYEVQSEGKGVKVSYPLREILAMLHNRYSVMPVALIQKSQQLFSMSGPRLQAGLSNFLLRVDKYNVDKQLRSRRSMRQLLIQALSCVPVFMREYKVFRERHSELQATIQRARTASFSARKVKAEVDQMREEVRLLEESLTTAARVADDVLLAYEMRFEQEVQRNFDFLASYEQEGRKTTKQVKRGSDQIRLLHELVGGSYGFRLRRLMLDCLCLVHIYKHLRDNKVNREDTRGEYLSRLPQPDKFRTGSITVRIDVDQVVEGKFQEPRKPNRKDYFTSREYDKAHALYERNMMLKRYAIVDEVFRRSIGYIDRRWENQLLHCNMVQEFMGSHQPLTDLLTSYKIYDEFKVTMSDSRQEEEANLELFYSKYLTLLRENLLEREQGRESVS